MADSEYGFQFRLTKVGTGAEETKRELDAVTGSADAAKKSLEAAGDAVGEIGKGAAAAGAAAPLKEVAEGARGVEDAAKGAGAQTLNLQELLGTLGGRGGAARDMLQGLHSVLSGNATALFDVAKGMQGFITSLATGPVGAFALAISAVVGGFYVLKDVLYADDGPILGLNDLGETAAAEKKRLGELDVTNLQFDNAKKGLDALKSKFKEDQEAAKLLETALDNLDKAQTARALAENEIARKQALAGAGGDKTKEAAINAQFDEAALEKQAQADVRQQTQEIARIQKKIADTSAQIEKEKQGQKQIEDATTAAGRQYAAVLVALSRAHIDPADVDTSNVGELIKKLEARLKELNEIGGHGLATGPGGAFDVGAENADQNIQAAIDALRRFGDVKAAWESDVKGIQDAATNREKNEREYQAQIAAMTVDLKTHKETLIKTLEENLSALNTALANATTRLAGAQANQNAAEQHGNISSAERQGYAEQTQSAASEVQRLQGLVGDATRAIDAAMKSLTDSISKAPIDMSGAGKAAVDVIEKATTGAASSIKKTTEAAAVDISASSDVVKKATEESTGKIITSVGTMADSYADGMRTVTTKVVNVVAGILTTTEEVQVQLDRVVLGQQQLAAKVEVVKAQVDNMR